MTSEVALMNRSAVALAADSATTVTYWDRVKSKHEQRFFKRTNKIFNMASGQPVGLMTFGSGSLQGMPWEILVKAYRDLRVGKPPFPKLAEYGPELFDFLSNNHDIFPAADQEAALASKIAEMAIVLGAGVMTTPDVKAEADAKKKLAKVKTALDLIENNVQSDTFINDVSKDLHKEIAKDVKYSTEFFKTSDGKFLVGILDAKTAERVFSIALLALFKSGYTELQYTGIVIAGYGDKEYLPQLEQFKVYGLFKDKLIYKRVDDQCKSIGATNVSEIVPIAQSRMIDTFRLGADTKILDAIDENLRKAIDEFSAELVKAKNLDPAVDVSAAKADVVRAFRERVKDHIWDEHGEPLRTVIGMLSPDELAELAETFVSAESLKERVTKPTESVSGPIDVAVITKGDGFIWIKRKHYFDPDLNLRFIAKKQQELKE